MSASEREQWSDWTKNRRGRGETTVNTNWNRCMNINSAERFNHRCSRSSTKDTSMLVQSTQRVWTKTEWNRLKEKKRKSWVFFLNKLYILHFMDFSTSTLFWIVLCLIHSSNSIRHFTPPTPPQSRWTKALTHVKTEATITLIEKKGNFNHTLSLKMKRDFELKQSCERPSCDQYRWSERRLFARYASSSRQ